MVDGSDYSEICLYPLFDTPLKWVFIVSSIYFDYCFVVNSSLTLSCAEHRVIFFDYTFEMPYCAPSYFLNRFYWDEPSVIHF